MQAEMRIGEEDEDGCGNVDNYETVDMSADSDDSDIGTEDSSPRFGVISGDLNSLERFFIEVTLKGLCNDESVR